MKKMISAFFAILFAVAANAQNGGVLISGQLQDTELKQITLGNLEGFRIDIPVDENGKFSLKVSLEKGFYQADPFGRIYLAPGYSLVVSPDKRGGYIFSGKGAVENNALKEASSLLPEFLPFAKNAFLQPVYYMEWPEFSRRMEDFKKKAKQIFSRSGDTHFQNLASQDIDFYALNRIWYYQLYYGTDLEKQEAFYKFLETADRTDTGFFRRLDSAYKASKVKKMDESTKEAIDSLLYLTWDRNDPVLFRNSPEYRQALSNMFQRYSYHPKYRDASDSAYDRVAQTLKNLRIVEAEISDPHIREYYEFVNISAALKMMKDSAEAEPHYMAYMQKARRADYRKQVEEIFRNLVSYTNSSQAPEFSFRDINGNRVSLKSLRGKYVYIDVWATWCGPCKAEIPHLQKMEKQFHGRNIAFVSISVDQQKDFPKWEQYVKENNLGGIQLIADNAFESDFVKKMNISAIPRFILIDPEGKLVAVDALRPSNPELTSLFKRLL